MELDVLKKRWNDIYFEPDNKIAFDPRHLGFKNSKSMMKTVTKRLFVVSMIEFIVWGVLSIGLHFLFIDSVPRSFLEFKPLIIIEKLNYLALGLFLAAFLFSFKTISVISDVKLLIERTIFTKRIVNYYIYFNVSVFAITFLFSFGWELFNNQEVSILLAEKGAGIYALIMLFGMIFTFAVTFALFKIYHYIYGRFVIDFGTLVRNFKELKKDEVI